MILIRKIVELIDLESHLRDLQFSKIEVKPAALKKLRNIAILCYYRVHPKDILQVRSALKNQSMRRDLPIEIKSKISGFHGNFYNYNLWMTLADFHDMIKIETEYKLNFGIPQQYRKLYHTLKTYRPDLLRP
jgi:hypothetical protein